MQKIILSFTNNDKTISTIYIMNRNGVVFATTQSRITDEFREFASKIGELFKPQMFTEDFIRTIGESVDTKGTLKALRNSEVIKDAIASGKVNVLEHVVHSRREKDVYPENYDSLEYSITHISNKSHNLITLTRTTNDVRLPNDLPNRVRQVIMGDIKTVLEREMNYEDAIKHFNQSHLSKCTKLEKIIWR